MHESDDVDNNYKHLAVHSQLGFLSCVVPVWMSGHDEQFLSLMITKCCKPKNLLYPVAICTLMQHYSM